MTDCLAGVGPYVGAFDGVGQDLRGVVGGGCFSVDYPDWLALLLHGEGSKPAVVGHETLQVQNPLLVLVECRVYLTALLALETALAEQPHDGRVEVAAVPFPKELQEVVNFVSLHSPFSLLHRVDRLQVFQSACGEHHQPDTETLCCGRVDVLGVLCPLDRVLRQFLRSCFSREVPR